MKMSSKFHKYFMMPVILAGISVGWQAQAETIDFEALPPGTVVTQVDAASGLGPIYVEGFNPDFLPGTDAALIFDSGNPTGGDDDLGTPNETFYGPGIGPGGESGAPFENSVELHHVLIVAENLVDSEPDGLVDDPDDAAVVGSQLAFDFDEIGPVTIQGITLLDVEGTSIILNNQPIELPAEISFYDASLTQIGLTLQLPQTGSNGLAPVEFDPPIQNVAMVVVDLKGSGAIDNIVFTGPQGGCTPGYWKQSQHFDSWTSPYAPGTLFGDVFEDAYSGLTLLQVLKNNGNKTGLEALGRHTVAALLNAARVDFYYPLSTVDVIAAFNAVYPGSKSDYNALKNQLVGLNEFGCPLN